MTYFLIEDIGVLLYEYHGQWVVENVNVEMIEMNCIKVDNKYYRRIRSVDLSTIEIAEIASHPERDFDDFDLQISCEEYYGG